MSLFFVGLLSLPGGRRTFDCQNSLDHKSIAENIEGWMALVLDLWSKVITFSKEDRTFFLLNDCFYLIVIKRIELKFNQIHHHQLHQPSYNTQPAFNFHSSSLSLLTNNNQSSIHHIEGCALLFIIFLFIIFNISQKLSNIIFPSFQTSFLHHQLSLAFFYD